MKRCLVALACVVLLAGCSGRLKEMVESAPLEKGGEIIIVPTVAANPDPYVAGKAAATALRKQFLELPRAVVVSECFPDERSKRKVLEAVCEVLPKASVFGGATYGSFTQDGCFDRDSVGLLGIGGRGVSVTAAIERNIGAAKLSAEKDQAQIETLLRGAGERLAARFPKRAENRLLIVFADAHAPKNAPLVEGLQTVLTKEFPVTGGSANRNAGQTFVTYQGRMFGDSAVGLMLAGEFVVAMVGRQAKDNDQVIATAREGVREAIAQCKGKPFAIIAFDCAGRKGKLKNIEDELQAMKESRLMTDKIPLFGCYGAGEIGPADVPGQKPGAPSSGVGWHVVFTVLGR